MFKYNIKKANSFLIKIKKSKLLFKTKTTPMGPSLIPGGFGLHTEDLLKHKPVLTELQLLPNNLHSTTVRSRT